MIPCWGIRLLEVAWWPTVCGKKCLSVCQDVWCLPKVLYKPENTKPCRLLQSKEWSKPEHTWGLDKKGPFPWSKRQNAYLLVVMDMFPLRDIKAQKIVLWRKIFIWWGIPKRLITNRGRQFTSKLLAKLCKTWGSVQMLSTSYHPQTNLTERINRA